MKFRDYEIDDTVVFEISGKVMGGDQKTRFHGRIHECLNQNLRKFVVDLRGVERMNSVGLGMLTSAYKTVTRAGGHFVLANVTNIASLLTITHLISVFPHYDGLESALAAASINLTA